MGAAGSVAVYDAEAVATMARENADLRAEVERLRNSADDYRRADIQSREERNAAWAEAMTLKAENERFRAQMDYILRCRRPGSTMNPGDDLMDVGTALHVITLTRKQINEEFPGAEVCAVREEAQSILTAELSKLGWALRRVVIALSWAESVADIRSVVIANVTEEDWRRYIKRQEGEANDRESL